MNHRHLLGIGAALLAISTVVAWHWASDEPGLARIHVVTDGSDPDVARSVEAGLQTFAESSGIQLPTFQQTDLGSIDVTVPFTEAGDPCAAPSVTRWSERHADSSTITIVASGPIRSVEPTERIVGLACDSSGPCPALGEARPVILLDALWLADDLDTTAATNRDLLIAHELGHALGLAHDEVERACEPGEAGAGGECSAGLMSSEVHHHLDPEEALPAECTTFTASQVDTMRRRLREST
jgi:hypothetical protein